MKLALRNRAAEWLLRALDQPAEDQTIRALIAFARRADATGCATGLPAGAFAALAAEDELFQANGRDIRLRPKLMSDLPALRDRSRRFELALAECRAGCGSSPSPRPPAAHGFSPHPLAATELGWFLCAAAVLFNQQLYFEVHELLESAWRRASDELRTFLQGLIQVAVGFHHHADGNLAGAASLLDEGCAKLAPHRPQAWGVQLEPLCEELERLRTEIRRQLACAQSAPISPPLLVFRR